MGLRTFLNKKLRNSKLLSPNLRKKMKSYRLSWVIHKRNQLICNLKQRENQLGKSEETVEDERKRVGDWKDL